jgi:hypothetical protein
VGRNRIARLMRLAGLSGVSRRKGCRTTNRSGDICPAPDLVERNFTATGPVQLWLADITYIPIDRHGANLFFQFISRRNKKGAMILTSNQPFSGWGEMFSDAVIPTTILDRVLHHSITINIKDESYRLKEMLKAGIVQRKEPKP